MIRPVVVRILAARQRVEAQMQRARLEVIRQQLQATRGTHP